MCPIRRLIVTTRLGYYRKSPSQSDRRARVWRMPNERFAPVCVAEHDRFGGGSVMVWAGISAQGKTDLHVIDNGTLTDLRYVNEILDVYVHPYAGAVGENFILMDDNARAHRARITDQYLEQATIVCMEWPAKIVRAYK